MDLHPKVLKAKVTLVVLQAITCQLRWITSQMSCYISDVLILMVVNLICPAALL